MGPGRSSRRQLAVAVVCAIAGVVYSSAKTPLTAQVAGRLSTQAGVEGPATGTSPIDQLRSDLLADTALPGVRRGLWGVIVHSLDRDERLFELNPSALLVPASVAKLVTAASAAEAVGWDFTFSTTLRATGPVVDGVLTGDLLVVGSGDPAIGGRAGDDLQIWVDALKASGLRRIEGRIIGDDDALEEPRPQLAWSWDDLGYTTGALFGALNLNENRMTVTVEGGTQDGSPASLSVEPGAAHRPLLNRVVTTTGMPQFVWPEQRPGEVSLTIAGAVRPNGGPVRLSVSVGNPTLWFAGALRDRLVRSGIEVAGDAADVDDVQPPPDRAASTLLYTYRSRPLSAIVQTMLKDSVNLYGEAVMRLNAAPGSGATNDAALEGLRQRVAAWGLPPDAQQLVDGSGLSRRDVVSPEALYVLLRRMQDPTGRSPFVAGLPVAGVDGSLVARMKRTPAEGNVRAKTGTMNNVRTLAGYVTTRDGEHLAFVIMANNFEGTGTAANLVLDRMAVRLASFTRLP